MTDDPAAQAARAAAVTLAPELGAGLPAQVEAALAARESGQRPDRYFDPIALASLIVSAASLAWNIYNDQRRHTPDPDPEAIAREVRNALREQDIVLPPRYRADHQDRRHRDHP